MQYFDIFRHADDDEKNEPTALGYCKIKTLVRSLQKCGITYQLFITSPYPQCIETLNIIIRSLGYSKKLIDHGPKLCTPHPDEWNQMFYNGKFQKLLPQLSSKYVTAVNLAPNLLLRDARHFICQLEECAKRIPDKNYVLGVSHNTIILAAASLIESEKLSVKLLNLPTLDISSNWILNKAIVIAFMASHFLLGVMAKLALQSDLTIGQSPL